MAEFEEIKTEEKPTEEIEEIQIPDWDLVPPFDTVDRGQM